MSSPLSTKRLGGELPEEEGEGEGEEGGFSFWDLGKYALIFAGLMELESLVMWFLHLLFWIVVFCILAYILWKAGSALARAWKVSSLEKAMETESARLAELKVALGMPLTGKVDFAPAKAPATAAKPAAPAVPAA